MKRASEVVEQLISRAFDSDPEEGNLTLAECLRLYAALVAGEAVSDAMAGSGAEEKPATAASVAAQRVYERDRSGEVPGLIDPDADDGAEKEEAGAPAPDTHTHTAGPIEGEGKLPDEQGRWAAEKRRVFQRLEDYRRLRGLGSFAKLEKAANGAITAELIRAIYVGDVRGTMTQWKMIDAAITYIEGQNSD